MPHELSIGISHQQAAKNQGTMKLNMQTDSGDFTDHGP